jgi:uncharacterized protein (DUF2252 family)
VWRCASLELRLLRDPDRQIVFDINDFDETLPGPFEWDLKRLAASFAVAGRTLGYGKTALRKINRRVGRAYREAMAEAASNRAMETWYARTVAEPSFFQEFRSQVGKRMPSSGRRSTSKGARQGRSAHPPDQGG